jgi:Phage tail tube protein
MPLDSKIGLFGLAKQSVKGTQVSPPLYGHGLSSGGLSHARDVAAQKLSSGARTSGNAILSGQTPGANPQSPAYVTALGLYLLAVMGADTVSGSGTYTHTYSHSALAWFSLYQSLGGSEYLSVYDAKCQDLKLSWTGDEPLVLDSTWVAQSIKPNQGSWTATNSLDQSSAFFVPAGGTFSFDTAGAAVTATVLSGDVTITNTIDKQIASGSTLPAVTQEGEAEPACTLVVVPDNLREWQQAITGTTSGATASEIPIYGQLSLQFVQAMGGAATLAITAARVLWDCAYPNPDTAGAAVQLSWAGLPLAATAASTPLVFALTNSVASY